MTRWRTSQWWSSNEATTEGWFDPSSIGGRPAALAVGFLASNRYGRLVVGTGDVVNGWSRVEAALPGSTRGEPHATLEEPGKVKGVRVSHFGSGGLDVEPRLAQEAIGMLKFPVRQLRVGVL